MSWYKNDFIYKYLLYREDGTLIGGSEPHEHEIISKTEKYQYGTISHLRSTARAIVAVQYNHFLQKDLYIIKIWVSGEKNFYVFKIQKRITFDIEELTGEIELQG